MRGPARATRGIHQLLTDGKLAEREGLFGRSALTPTGPSSLRSGVQIHLCRICRTRRAFSCPLSFYLQSQTVLTPQARHPFNWRRERDSNPRYAFTYTRFPGVLLQPLRHLSEIKGTVYFLPRQSRKPEKVKLSPLFPAAHGTAPVICRQAGNNVYIIT